MQNILTFALCVCGGTYLVTTSALLATPRTVLVWLLQGLRIPNVWIVAVYCAACTGCWVGVGLFKLGLWPNPSQSWLTLFNVALFSTAVGAIWSLYGPEPAIAEVDRLFGDKPPGASAETD